MTHELFPTNPEPPLEQRESFLAAARGAFWLPKTTETLSERNLARAAAFDEVAAHIKKRQVPARLTN